MTALAQFHFLRPLWLLAILPAFAVALALWRARSSGANWRRAIAPELLDLLLDARRERRARWPWWLAFGGWLLGSIALAGPTWEKLPQPVLEDRDALVVVLDLSLSMRAQDVEPSRLQRARYKIIDLLQRRREGLTGLVVYSGDAHIVTPLTDDTATIANLVPALAPGMMPVYGSDVVDGISDALQLLKNSGVSGGRILLITDGIQPDDIDAIADRLRGSGHALSILGVGTEQGAPIPVNGGFLKTAGGSIAIPQLHGARLQALANRVDGRYTTLTNDDSDLDRLLPRHAPKATELRTTHRTFDQWRERGPWLVLLLLPLAALAFRRGWLLGLLLAITLLSPGQHALAAQHAPAQSEHRDTASSWLQHGKQLWRDLWQTPDQQAADDLADGHPRAAARRFTNPAWRAAAQYRAGDYEQAARAFQGLRGPDGKTSADADYNRGNALAHAGQLQAAIDAYDAALKKNPQLQDAKANRKQVENLLRRRQASQPDRGQSQSGQRGNGQNQSSPGNARNNDSGRQQQAGPGGNPQSAQAHRGTQQSSGQSAAGRNRDQSGDQADNAAGRAQQQHADNATGSRQHPAGTGRDQAAGAAGKNTTGKQRQAGDNGLQSKPAAPQQAQAASGTAGRGKSPKAHQPGNISDSETAAEQRHQQIMEQWLRQIPDDPSGLLRRKFEYEYRQQEQKPSGGDRPIW